MESLVRSLRLQVHRPIELCFCVRALHAALHRRPPETHTRPTAAIHVPVHPRDARPLPPDSRHDGLGRRLTDSESARGQCGLRSLARRSVSLRLRPNASSKNDFPIADVNVNVIWIDRTIFAQGLPNQLPQLCVVQIFRIEDVFVIACHDDVLPSDSCCKCGAVQETWQGATALLGE